MQIESNRLPQFGRALCTLGKSLQESDPNISTLRKHAAAAGLHLTLRFEPKHMPPSEDEDLAQQER